MFQAALAHLSFCGSVFVQDTLEPWPSTGETQEILKYVSCCCNMTEIMLKTV